MVNIGFSVTDGGMVLLQPAQAQALWSSWQGMALRLLQIKLAIGNCSSLLELFHKNKGRLQPLVYTASVLTPATTGNYPSSHTLTQY
jgi:hypothetical protein